MNRHSGHRRSLTCNSTGKRRFRDHREAVDALHDASNVRAFAAMLGQHSTRREVRSYRCQQCRGWHLTSQPTYSEVGAR